MMRVYFWRPDAKGRIQATQTRSCNSASTMNFYLAGMEQNTAYQAEHLIFQADLVNVGPVMGLTTGSVPAAITSLSAASQTVLQGPPASVTDWMLLQGPLGLSAISFELTT